MRSLISLFASLWLGAALAFGQPAAREDVLANMETCRTLTVEPMRAARLAAAEDLLRSPDPRTPDPRAEAPLPAQTVQAPPAPTESAAATPAPAPATETRSLRQRFGLAPPSERDSADNALAVTVVRIAKIGPRRGRFYLSDGSVLEQFSSGFSLRDPSALPAQATLERRLFGSKWLTFDEAPKRGYKVKIIQQSD